MAVAPARLAGRQRHDLLLRDRAAPDRARLVLPPRARLVAPLASRGRRSLSSSACRSPSSPAPRRVRLAAAASSPASRWSMPPPPTTASSATWRPRSTCSSSTTPTSTRVAAFVRARLHLRRAATCDRGHPTGCGRVCRQILLLTAFVVVCGIGRTRQLRRFAGVVRRRSCRSAASTRHSASSTRTTCSARSRARASKPEFQTTDDGTTWVAHEFRHKPGDPKRRPDWVAPHQPRVDFQLWFYGLSYRAGAPEYVTKLLERLCRDPDAVAPLFRAPLPRASARRAHRLLAVPIHGRDRAPPDRRLVEARPASMSPTPFPATPDSPKATPSTTSDPPHERFAARFRISPA